MLTLPDSKNRGLCVGDEEMIVKLCNDNIAEFGKVDKQVRKEIRSAMESMLARKVDLLNPKFKLPILELASSAVGTQFPLVVGNLNFYHSVLPSHFDFAGQLGTR